jgi:hypothetical protein
LISSILFIAGSFRCRTLEETQLKSAILAEIQGFFG